VFLGRFSESLSRQGDRDRKESTGILITESLKVDDRNILTAGEIYKAPYFILDVTYDRLGFWKKMLQAFHKKGKNWKQPMA